MKKMVLLFAMIFTMMLTLTPRINVVQAADYTRLSIPKYPKDLCYDSARGIIWIALSGQYGEVESGLAKVNLTKVLLGQFSTCFKVYNMTQYNGAQGVAVDPNGIVWLSSTYPSEDTLVRIMTFNPVTEVFADAFVLDGVFSKNIKYANGFIWYMSYAYYEGCYLNKVNYTTKTIQSRYSMPTGFGLPSFMTVDGRYLWMTVGWNTGGGSVDFGYLQKFDMNTNTFVQNKTGLKSPIGVAVSSTLVYVARWESEEDYYGPYGEIHVYNKIDLTYNKTLIVRPPNYGYCLYALHYDIFGNLWWTTTGPYLGVFGITNKIYNVGWYNYFCYSVGATVWVSGKGSSYVDMYEPEKHTDVNYDGKVDLRDVFWTGKAYGSVVNDTRYNAPCDIDSDGKIDLKDYYWVCKDFGKIFWEE